ncbi:helix-turn-helix transcriptional regulator (plasmid) [Rouxiella badensis]|uniref:HTH cro/C1-type domain-containing protein n=1 Tax=Rouxiella badensis TaxID=1646377 RepID=A0A1X0WAY3_9GAMM|nr:helix-turn-helix transcriptional regulator [Rouxiella badensis]ORJ23924.1 hypothetical protein BS640_18640 [Rouxiella badensis]WAT03174.1 helix-turn-helix transcriptional regulator [Rouxiella badensis]
MKRGQWLQARREELKLKNSNNASAWSLRGVAEALGVSHSALSHLERSDAMPSLDFAIKLAELYGKPVEWVLTGVDAAMENGIPIVGTTLTGPAADYLNHGYDPEKFHQFVDIPTSGARSLYGLRIVDNLQSVAYPYGDVVIFEKDGRRMPGELYLVKLRSDDNFIQVLSMVNTREEGIVFNSAAEPLERMTFHEDEILFMHPLVAVVSAWNIQKV